MKILIALLFVLFTTIQAGFSQQATTSSGNQAKNQFEHFNTTLGINAGVLLINGGRIGLNLHPSGKFMYNAGFSLSSDYPHDSAKTDKELKMSFNAGAGYYLTKKLSVGSDLIISNLSKYKRTDLSIELPTLTWISNTNDGYYFSFKGGPTFLLYYNLDYHFLFMNGFIFEFSFGYNFNI